uniref:SecY-independent transporter protein n=1 Tax=Pyropia nitida TaxID=1682381 RepID=A0A0U2E2C0_9RHOD|nr:SecY-independent transporter protein [Pyropia nitida]AKQ53246.1 SecY-independent transporter protein [Pyropia nitida]
MQIPLHFYLNEIKWRFYYFCFSFIICLIIILNYHEAVFFWSTYSFSFVNKNRFITTHIAELFATSMYVSINIVSFINFPYAYYHCNSFFSSGWYKSQIWFFTNLQIFMFIVLGISIFISYFTVLPYAYAFLDTWTITTIYAFKVQLEARIETYVYWMFQTTCLLSNTMCFFLGRLMYLFLLDNMINLHIFYRKNKKYVLFLVFVGFFICLPPENMIQLYYFFFIVLFYELFFFITCLFFAKNNV